MRRFLIIVILFCFSSLSFAQRTIDYKTFTQLPRQEQHKVVQMVWDYLITVDENRIQDIKQQETVRIYKKILNFFIASAYADSSPIIQVHVNEKQCLWGGWFSLYDVYKKRCIPPSEVASSIKNNLLKDEKGKRLTLSEEDKKYFLQLADAYKKEASNAGCGSNAKGAIVSTDNTFVCNPLVFGYDPTRNNKPFCSTKNDHLNTSLNCWKGVNKLSEENKQKVLDGIVKKITEGGDNDKLGFSSMMAVMYDTCMCKGNAGYINKTYGEKIFYDRTCYGLMKQSENILDKVNTSPGACESLSNITFNNNIDNMKEFGITFYDQIKTQFYKDDLKTWSGDVHTGKNKNKDVDFLTSREAEYKNNIARDFCKNDGTAKLVLTHGNGEIENKTNILIPKLQNKGTFKEFKHAYYSWHFSFEDKPIDLSANKSPFIIKFPEDEPNKTKKNKVTIEFTKGESDQTTEEQVFKIKAKTIVVHDNSLFAEEELTFKLAAKAKVEPAIVVPEIKEEPKENNNETKVAPSLTISSNVLTDGQYELTALLNPTEGFDAKLVSWKIDDKVGQNVGLDKITLAQTDKDQIIIAEYQLAPDKKISSSPFTIPKKTEVVKKKFELTVDGEDDEKDSQYYIVTATVSPDDETSLHESKIEFKNDGEKVEGQPNSRRYKKEKDIVKVSVSFTPSPTVNPEQNVYNDNIEIPALDKKDYTITITLNSENKTEGQFSAKIDGKDEVPEGYSIKWYKIEKDSYIDNDEEDTFDDGLDYSEEDEESTEENKTKDNEEDKKDKDKEDEKTEKASESIKEQADEAGSGITIKISKADAILEVFAVLVPEDESSESVFSNKLDLEEKTIVAPVHNVNPIQLPVTPQPQNIPSGPRIHRGVL